MAGKEKESFYTSYLWGTVAKAVVDGFEQGQRW